MADISPVEFAERLNELNYFITLEEGGIKYEYKGIGDPPGEAGRLLQLLKDEPELRDGVIDYLKRQFDPRRDLEGDSFLWQRLLRTAWEYDSYSRRLHGNLHGIRCEGARLRIEGDKLRIKPPEDYSSDEWEKIRKRYLLPFKREIIKLLEEAKNEQSKQRF